MGISINPILGEDTLQTFYPKVNANLEAINVEIERIAALVEAIAPTPGEGEETPASITELIEGVQSQINDLNAAIQSQLNALKVDNTANKSAITSIQTNLTSIQNALSGMVLSAWQPLPMRNGWGPAAGTNIEYRLEGKLLTIRGSIVGGTYANGTIVAQLPPNIAISQVHRFHGVVLSTTFYRPCILILDTDGSIKVDRINTGGCTWLSMDLVQFYVE